MRPTLVISGGQTGADQGALRAATACGIPTGGWCPLRCRTETGNATWLIKRYGLKETPTDAYIPRTIANVRMADLTILYGETRTPGSRAVLKTIEREGKALWINPSLEELAGTPAAIINVAGNRESGNRGIEAAVFAILTTAWQAADGHVIPAPWPQDDPTGMSGLKPLGLSGVGRWEVPR